MDSKFNGVEKTTREKFFPPIIRERDKRWVHKATFTVLVSQLGLLILLFFIGPSELFVNEAKNSTDIDNIPTFFGMWCDTFIEYLQKGSLLLSIMSLGANAAANYFWDVRKGNEDLLLFETNKTFLIVFLVLVFSAGIVYGIIPNEISIYFILLQLIMFAMLVIYIYKINYVMFYKEQSYIEEVHEEQISVLKGVDVSENSNYKDDIDNQENMDKNPGFSDDIDNQGNKDKNPGFSDDIDNQGNKDKNPGFSDDIDNQENMDKTPGFSDDIDNKNN